MFKGLRLLSDCSKLEGKEGRPSRHFHTRTSCNNAINLSTMP